MSLLHEETFARRVIIGIGVIFARRYFFMMGQFRICDNFAQKKVYKKVTYQELGVIVIIKE